MVNKIHKPADSSKQKVASPHCVYDYRGVYKLNLSLVKQDENPRLLKVLDRIKETLELVITGDSA